MMTNNRIYEMRLDRLRKQLHDEQIEAILITNPLNVTYLTGFSGDSSFFLVLKYQAYIISDTRFQKQLEEECSQFQTCIRDQNKTTWQEAGDRIRLEKLADLAYEARTMTCAQLNILQALVPHTVLRASLGVVERLRVIKDDGEIQAIRDSVAMGQQAQRMMIADLSDEMSELWVAGMVELNIRKQGGRGVGFPTIVATGERSALPHALPTTRPVGEAGFLLLDWGAQARFYTSDLTRIILCPNFHEPKVRQRVESTLRKIYTVVLQAQKCACAAIRPGSAARDIDRAARSVIEDAGYGMFFRHGLGHGIGLEVHEAPDLRQTSADILRPGMVITIEPGIYLPDLGGVRIEDDILVTDDGYEVISHKVAKEWDEVTSLD